MKVRYYAYDVWGNEEEGYDVNDILPGKVMDIPQETLENDSRFIRALEYEGCIAMADGDGWIIQGEDEFTDPAWAVYLYYMGKPIGEVRKVK